MGQNTLSDREMQMQRLKIKQLNQQMQNLAAAGTGISAWEARELVNVIEEVYFSDPDLKLLLPGQMKYSCVSTSAPLASWFRLAARSRISAPAVLGTTSVILISLVFSLVTIATMVGLVLAGRFGLNILRFPWLERFAPELAGGTVIACGLAIVCLSL